jgi:hypothetical protein
MRRRHREPELIGTRRSKSFYPVDSPQLQDRMARAIPRGYYTHLLEQDLDHVVPYTMGRGDGPTAVAVGDDTEHRAALLISNALSARQSHAWLDDSIRTFINRTAQILVLYGPATYEIDYLSRPDAESDQPPEAFGLDLIPLGTLAHRGKQPIQYVLPTLGTLKDKSGLTYVELDPTTLVTFNLAPESDRDVRKVVSFLTLANTEQEGTYALATQAMRGPSPYRFSEHLKEKADLFARATEPIGWNVRELFTTNHLEPYDLWRSLRFLEFKVRLREAILAQLNQALDVIGKTMGFAVTIELRGLASLADVEAAQLDLASGRRGIGELKRFAVEN